MTSTVSEEKPAHRYSETVFVTGDIRAYTGSLGEYFRESREEAERWRTKAEKELESVRWRIGSAERFGQRAFMEFSDDDPPIGPRALAEKQVADLEERIEKLTLLAHAQRINSDRVREVLIDGKPVETLDLTNHAYKGHVVRITAGEHEERPAIRMRVFREQNYTRPETYRRESLGESFARHARSIEGVDAFTGREQLSERPPSLEEFVESGQLRRSTTRVRRPVFYVEREGDEIRHSQRLSPEEQEMLRIFPFEHGHQNLKFPSSLVHGSDLWSPAQGHKILRNLYGILGISNEGGRHGRWYHYLWIDRPNHDALAAALEDGGWFTRTVPLEAAETLTALLDRREELQAKYGGSFSPFFTPKELATRTGKSKAATGRDLAALSGVLAPVSDFWRGDVDFDMDTYNNKFSTCYLLSRARETLAYQVVRAAGLR